LQHALLVKLTKPYHPVVELRFRSISTLDRGRIPMVQVCDVTTGEVLMVELLGDVGTWLAAMGYEWTEGTHAVWERKP
jgi:hypothetical protein